MVASYCTSHACTHTLHCVACCAVIGMSGMHLVLSLPLASSRCLSLPLDSSRFLSLLLVFSLPLHTLIRPHARTDAALPSYSRTPMHTHLCTHMPACLPAVSHAHCIAILPLLPSFFVFVFLFPLLWAAAGCGVVASHTCLSFSCLFSSQYTTSSFEHLEPPASCPVSHLPPPLIYSNMCPPLYLAPRLISPLLLSSFTAAASSYTCLYLPLVALAPPDI